MSVECRYQWNVEGMSVQVDTATCYRTGGSVRVPAQAREKVKRRIKLHRYSEDTVEEAELETAADCDTDRGRLFWVSAAVSEVAPAAVLSSEQLLPEVRTCSPPPPPPKPIQQCQKHSRCHCDLLSLGTDNFFAVSTK